MKKIILLLIACIAIIGCTSVQDSPTESPEEVPAEDNPANIVGMMPPTELCNTLNGIWVEPNECEGISQSDCLAYGGSFNERASACRHQPSAEVCTMNCVPVCTFA